jgi:hypothetical protein
MRVRSNGTMLHELPQLDADHRRHAVCELAIRDLKAGAGLVHLPSGRFATTGGPGSRARRRCPR